MRNARWSPTALSPRRTCTHHCVQDTRHTAALQQRPLHVLPPATNVFSQRQKAGSAMAVALHRPKARPTHHSYRRARDLEITESPFGCQDFLFIFFASLPFRACRQQSGGQGGCGIGTLCESPPSPSNPLCQAHWYRTSRLALMQRPLTAQGRPACLLCLPVLA